jgi:hypothetical protein
MVPFPLRHNLPPDYHTLPRPLHRHHTPRRLVKVDDCDYRSVCSHLDRLRPRPHRPYPHRLHPDQRYLLVEQRGRATLYGD